MCRQTRDSAHQLVILYNPVLCVETLLEPSLYYKLCINYTININQNAMTSTIIILSDLLSFSLKTLFTNDVY